MFNPARRTQQSQYSPIGTVRPSSNQTDENRQAIARNVPVIAGAIKAACCNSCAEKKTCGCSGGHGHDHSHGHSHGMMVPNIVINVQSGNKSSNDYTDYTSQDELDYSPYLQADHSYQGYDVFHDQRNEPNLYNEVYFNEPGPATRAEILEILRDVPVVGTPTQVPPQAPVNVPTVRRYAVAPPERVSQWYYKEFP